MNKHINLTYRDFEILIDIHSDYGGMTDIENESDNEYLDVLDLSTCVQMPVVKDMYVVYIKYII